MSKFFDGINDFFKAEWWSGGSWLLVLCVIHAVTTGIYVGMHLKIKGHEYVQLDPDQGKILTDLLAIYPDTGQPTSLLIYNAQNLHGTDSIAAVASLNTTKNLRNERAKLIHQFLRTAYHGEVDTTQLIAMDAMLYELNARDVATYMTTKQFEIGSFFWLAGGIMYWEALLWAFIGVVTSLIYYVSLATQLSLKNSHDDDIGPFDPSEISAQVAKMFYAPVITLVVLLGYNYISGNNKGMVNISVGHGLILFSFIAGFYSGRVMKLLDSIKNLILPVSSDGNKPAGPAAVASGDIAVEVKLSAAAAASPDGSSMTETGFNNAVVSLVPASGDPIKLTKPADDQGSTFTGVGIAFGAYTVKATYAFNNKQTIVNLAGSATANVDAQHLQFTVELDKADGLG